MNRRSRRAGAQRGALVRRSLVVMLGVVATVAITTALQQPAAATPRLPGPSLGTPLWSIRRTPQPVTDAVGAQHLQAALTAATGGNRACFEVQTGGTLLAAASPDTALTPASTIKLLTATAALDQLGAEFHFTTTAQGSGAPRNGTVDRLYLVGHGDPLLASPERIAKDQQDPETAGFASTPLATLAERIKAAGINAIPGGIVGVDNRYESIRYAADWPASTRAAIGPIGALTVNDGYSGPAGSGAAVSDPALNAAAELTRLLKGLGVTAGTPTHGDAPSKAEPVASIDSPPLPLILTEMLSASDNLTAEMLIRELGARTGDGTPAKGAGIVLDSIKTLAVPTAGVTMVDGSGLSQRDAVPCQTLQAILALTAQPKFGSIRDGLAIAGQRGTLAPRFVGTPLAGNLRAKTGTLSGVSGLAGFVTSDRLMTFSLLVNGSFGESAAFSTREAMVKAIASYPQTVGGAELDPEPNVPIPPRACPGADLAC